MLNNNRPAIFLALLVALCLPAWAVEECVGSPTDICEMKVATNDSTDKITVMLQMGDTIDYGLPVKYRVHFDYEAPFYYEEDRNGDGGVDESDFCVSTSDAGMMWQPDKGANGPGSADATDNAIIFEVTLTELGVPVDATEIHIWSDVQVAKGGGGIVDRVPDTDGSNGCDKPETETEAKALYLPTYQLTCPCWSGYTKGELLAILNDPQIPGLEDNYCVAPPRTCVAPFCGQEDVNTAAVAWRAISLQTGSPVEDIIAAGEPAAGGPQCVWTRLRVAPEQSVYEFHQLTQPEALICMQELTSLMDLVVRYDKYGRPYRACSLEWCESNGCGANY